MELDEQYEQFKIVVSQTDDIRDLKASHFDDTQQNIAFSNLANFYAAKVNLVTERIGYLLAKEAESDAPPVAEVPDVHDDSCPWNEPKANPEVTTAEPTFESTTSGTKD